ncbi:ABC transporter permease [Anaerocolumna sp. MB42-C2]|uniref:ABC transporter permease n=1 Tax=Anaerocolumna sp. MB42-C2 TaxID=3070997 RepID=UPI0027E1AED1|nr:ABC transporter permease subunit [Anaerocolumna sp. MB42-C2]WMJ88990.1 ABC transporter permease subunit [Anaerocolumna sp. MB42-C2]
MQKGKKKRIQKKRTKAVIRENLQLYGLMLPVLVLIVVFCYGPMFGLIIAFQDYLPGAPFFGGNVQWVGLDHFQRFIEGKYFGRLIKNTLVLSGLNLLFGFTAPILFALLIDQIKRLKLKKFAQTASYMPYFISTVVVAGMVLSFIDEGGMVTNFLTNVFGLPNKNWRNEALAFPTIYTITNVWKGFGFGSILYISSIASIDQSQYESAKIDGANRWHQCRYITLPGIKNIIAINLILAIGGILGTNSDLILLLYSPATYDVADVIGTYTYRLGIISGEYSYTAAAGLFMSAIGFVLTFIANKISNKMTGFGLW